MILSKYHVACNIYLSAGLPVYRAALERLLKEAQQQQTTLRSTAAAITIVHAFADTHYDRSSFHLAGSPCAIANLATSITTNAMQVLAPLKLSKEDQQSLEHPTVGIVDHISILPLDDNNPDVRMTWDEWRNYYNDNNQKTKNLPDSFSQSSLSASSMMPTSTIPSGWVAWTIGWNLVHQENLPVDVLYYGHAHRSEMPLAQVRREKTNFFRSSTTTTSNDDDTPSLRFGQCTIGAPPHFVENYNLRLTNKCSQQLARSLTRAVREKDGGLPFVEALTLPYGSQDRFEVACNLLHPKVTSTNDIDARVVEFFLDNEKEMGEYLEVAYRVGTTEEQCRKAIEDCQMSSSNMEQLERHDGEVRQRFQECFF